MTFPLTQQGRLVEFRPEHAERIASWVDDNRQLLWLAPSTLPPLTPEKVRNWCNSGGRAYVYGEAAAVGELDPLQVLGYAELNRLRHDPNGWWIGHFVVDSQRRGRGIGRSVLRCLASAAFDGFAASNLCLVVFPENAAAIRCYESAGFRRVGEEFHRFGRLQSRHRLLRYDMSLDEWRAGKAG